MDFRRCLLLVVMIGLASCRGANDAFPNKPTTDKLTIGVVSYGDDELSLAQYQRFQNYLAEQTKIAVELEIAYNELRAVQQIKQGSWSLVFSPPGLAVLAEKQGYSPLFALQKADKSEQSLMVVRKDSVAQTLNDLSLETVAMGEPGSAAGYYLPLYELYGLTLKAVKFAPSPQALLTWIEEGTAVAGALSEPAFTQYKRQFPEATFRILHRNKRTIPSGVVLLGGVDDDQADLIKQVMIEAPADLISEAQYAPTVALPDYSDMVSVVERINPLEVQVRQSPAVLTREHLGETTPSDSD